MQLQSNRLKGCLDGIKAWQTASCTNKLKHNEQAGGSPTLQILTCCLKLLKAALTAARAHDMQLSMHA
jgi:hypothetical protein